METSSSEIRNRQPKWVEPNFDHERGEIERTAEALALNQDELFVAYQQGKIELLRDEEWRELQNADSRDETWTLDQVREHLRGERDFDRIEQGILSGERIPVPIVLYRTGSPPYLIGGNSRLLACRAMGIHPMVWKMRVS